MAGNTGLPGESGFDATKFRNAITGVMTMALPQQTSQRVQFVFRPDQTFVTADNEGNPYSWDDTPATTTGGDGSGNPEYVEVPVALEFVARSSQARDTSMGFLLPSHIELYILDTYIDQVRDADEVLVDGNLYNINAWYPPIGLFSVNVYSCLIEAVDQSGGAIDA